MRCATLASLVAVVLAGVAAVAAAEPVRAVVRDAGDGDDEALDRLRGQVVDLDVEVIDVDGALERGLDAQIEAAADLADAHAARAVVWFVASRRGVTVVVATPGDRRVFVRELATGDRSADAEAAAVAARSALRAIALGGTIGVEVPRDAEPAAEPPPVLPRPAPRTRWGASAGWQGAADGGADAGAHAVRLGLDARRGRLVAGAELAGGAPARRDGAIAVDLSRSSALVEAGYARGGLRATLGAGALLYRRATVEVPDGLAATPSAFDLAAVVAPAVTWRLGGGRVGVELTAGLDVVLGAPRLIVDRGDGTTEILAEIAGLQPRAGVGVHVELW